MAKAPQGNGKDDEIGAYTIKLLSIELGGVKDGIIQ